jgi:hypothetical protein
MVWSRTIEGKSSMKWFKHYHNADTSKDLGWIISDMGLEGYARYWLLMELLFENFDGQQTVFEIPWRRVSTKLSMRTKRQLNQFELQLKSNSVPIKLLFKNSKIIFETSIPLELMGRDFKKARSERGKTAPKILDIRNKNEEYAKSPNENNSQLENSVKTFDDQFSKFFQDVKFWLAENNLRFSQNQISRICKEFETPDKFSVWVAEIENSKKLENRSNRERQLYLAGALKSLVSQ